MLKLMSLVSAPLPVSVSLQAKHVNGVGWNDHHDCLLRLVNDCANISQLKQIHAQALRTMLHHDARGLFIQSRIMHVWSLVDAEYACRMFHQVSEPNAFMWNTLIRSFALSRDRKVEAILVFQRMLEEGSVAPDKHTFPFVLKACAYQFASEEGKQLHTMVFKLGFDRDVYVNNSLIHFYASCGCLKSARDVFLRMSSRTVVSWNAMISALVEHGEFESSLQLFQEMQESFKPDGYTMQSVLNACAGLGSLSLGMWTHLYLLKHFEPDVIDDVLVNSSLVDMYCKSGSLELAKKVFQRMPRHSVHSWNSMILGFAMHGQAEAAINYFSDMTTEGLVPNSVTFVGVLSACNHRGMVDEGRKYFGMMIKDYNIDRQIEHYGCLVDLLARAGLIQEALDLVSDMSMKPDMIIWRSLLDACSKKNAGIELSEDMAEQILESGGETCSSVYVLLSRVYASARRWNEVVRIRKLMRERGIAKEPGCSSLEIDGVSHEFFAGDVSHPQTNAIYRALDEIDEKLDAAGYSPDVSQALMAEDESCDDKRSSLRLHSERLAIAFGLLNRKNGVPIRIFKNLRVCNDCHQVTKLISRAYDVEIVVRDRARFHHFKDGLCSCKDYW